MKSNKVFNSIAPIYGLFYNYQIKAYRRNMDILEELIDFSTYKKVIDIGCGTGALCKVLSDKGFDVTGLDSAYKMLNVAKKNLNHNEINFVQANILEKLPFIDKSFDIAITSYVAHGLKEQERRIMYAEMQRITKHFIVIYDYNDKRSILSNIVEWFEGSDYFNFIKNIKKELHEYFGDVTIINMGSRSSCYIVKARPTKK